MTPTNKPESANNFNGLGIAPKLLQILADLRFVLPTPIQRQAIPVAMTGQDVIGIAETGTGKTLAFGLPMIQRLASKGGMGLIILPTRELAVQVDESLRAIGRSFNLRTAVLIGGASMSEQSRAIGRKPHIIIGTPGRIIDHLERGAIKLNVVSALVLDEADRMLDMGFAPQIKTILRTVPQERQTMLFSATMPEDIAKIAAGHMKSPVRIEISRSGTAPANIRQELFIVGKDQKNRLLEKLLSEYRGTVLVFSRTKFGAKKICRVARDMGHNAADIHSNKSLAQRREALEGFKGGKYRILVATDIVARGIDVRGIELVINYDIPEHSEDYVHRVGRTGRAGLSGRAISFATVDQKNKVRNIERLIKKPLVVSPLPDLPPARQLTAVGFVNPRAKTSRRPYKDNKKYWR